MEKQNLGFAFISMAIAVLLGAMAAHALKELITPNQLNSFQTGVRYQVYHSLAIIIITTASPFIKTKFYHLGITFMKIGILVFSGSIYLLAIKDILGIAPIKTVLGPITPLGGIFLIVSWVLLAVGTFKKVNH